ncbi:MAG: sugar phosphate isomerase/epimerase [Verrucomicrobiota bacterium]
MNRRQALVGIGSALSSSALRPLLQAEESWSPRYVLSSAMYGDLPLAEVLPEVSKTGSVGIDIWRKVHATHREQIDEMGEEKFQSLLSEHQVDLAVSTCYPLGPFRQDDEMRWVKKHGGSMTVCGSGRMGEKDPVGAEAKRQVAAFFEKLRPHYELAEELGITMAIENHKNSTLSSPDSIRYFYELNPSKQVGLALAPHHLYDAIDQIPSLIRDGGREQLPFIYFQEFHLSSKEEMVKVAELKQMPGFGSLDYVPILAAMREIEFDGLAEIFMHPTPRGEPMLPTAGEITQVINHSREYLTDCLAQA